jgi:hypothetical protein
LLCAYFAPGARLNISGRACYIKHAAKGFIPPGVVSLDRGEPFGLSLDPDAQKRPAALRRNIAKAVRLLSEYEIEGG